MRITALALVGALVLVAGCSQQHLEIFPPLDDAGIVGRPLSVAQMHEDVDAFIARATAIHPDIAAYADQEAIFSETTRLKQQINRPLSRVEFFRQVGQLNHLLGDGHSQLLWPYPEFERLKAEGHQTFPFEVVLTRDGKLRVSNEYRYGESVITAGSSIVSINGLSATAVLETLQRYAGGESLALREHAVARRFGRNLWAALGMIDEFTIELEHKGSIHSFDIGPAQSWEKVDLADDGGDHYYRTLNDGVGYLYLGHFDVPPADFESFIDESFETMRRQAVRSLIIDIRNNPGGNTDTVTYLARHLADKPFRLVSSVREKLNDNNRGWLGYRGSVGEILVTDWNEWEEPVATSERFSGDSYLLVGTVSYSAAIVLATTLQDNDFATLVGVPTGGFANQTAQGNLFNLPNSQLRAYVATRTLVRPSGDPARNVVEPDYMVHSVASDIAEGIDATLAYTLELIESGADGG